MPRERFDDLDTPGLYAQVNWRKPDDDGTGNPGYLQLSTHDERIEARARELLDEAKQLVAMHTSAVRSGESDSDEMLKARESWWGKLSSFQGELTATYVTLTPDTAGKMIKSLHKGRNQAWPPGQPKLPGALDGVEIPRAGEAPPRGTELPAPGATGYPMST